MVIEWELYGQYAAALVALAALVFGAYKSLNGKASAYTLAANSLALAKALDDLPIDHDDVKDAEQRKALQRRLQDVGYFHSQLYLNSATPYLTSWRQPFLFYFLAFASLIWFAMSPITGSSEDTFSQLALVFVPASFLLAGYQATSRVGRNKAVNKKLAEEARLFHSPDQPVASSRLDGLHRLTLLAEQSRSRRNDD